MKIQNENLFKHSLAEGINIFVGAGFSLAASSNGKAMPTGDQLKDELLIHFNRKQPSKLNLTQLCQILTSTHRYELLEYFNNRFRVTDFDPLYSNLERANIKSIFTTNIDDLVFKIFEESTKYYINDIVLRGPSISGSNAIDYIALHGSVTHGDGEFAFSPLEISASFERDKDKWFGYIGRIQTTPTIYWGYRIEDAGVLQALAKETVTGRNKADAWIVLRSNDEEAIEYYSSLGFQIIIGDTLQLLKYMGQLSVRKQIGASKSLVSKNFKEYQLPNISTVPVRSLSEFYLGAEPTWYDVFSGKIYQTKHFTAAKDAIVSGTHVMLIGAAVTGKTTLLKQLATGLAGVGVPLYVEEITPEKAGLLVRDIDAEGQPILVFIDNAADASDAIQILLSSANVKIVAAERDYIFDSVSHKFPRKKFTILDVSGLSDLDTQAVQNHIPVDVKRKQFIKVKDPLAADAEPTFFEVITSIITADSLADRFIEAIRNLKITKPAEHDLLLMACYLYACRIPTSVDVATAFSRRYSVNAVNVLSMLQSMGSLLSPYEGVLADSNQAFFVPRSRAVAEIVMKKISASELRNLLEVFHADVSPTKIGRYDIFRRNAYDAKTVGRAFQNWEEGLEFYNQAFNRDHTHSLKQQGALYLSSKKNHELAFSWIDDALAMAGGFNPTVRNTYAVILFTANFEKPASIDVMSSLDESLAILQKCHHDDYRKVYHAKIFAEYSLKYLQKFPLSPNVRTYLEKSHEWLSEELRLRSGDRWMNSLSRQIKSALRSL